MMTLFAMDVIDLAMRCKNSMIGVCWMHFVWHKLHRPY